MSGIHQAVIGSFLSVKEKLEFYVWGNNSAGQLGINNRSSRQSPVQVGEDDWSETAMGNEHCVSVKNNGTLWSWGINTTGNLGLGNRVNRSSPVQVGSDTSWYEPGAGGEGAGGGHSVCTKTDGTIWSWGNGGSGRLGHGNVINRSSPVQIGALTNWARVACGDDFTLAVKTNGTMWSWGRASAIGQTGQNNLINLSSPVQIGADTNWAQVAAGGNHSLAVKTNGQLWAWGSNSEGRLGINDQYSRSSPVQVGALTTWEKLTNLSNAQSSGALKRP
jgi:alpha-tubulin suppressor-like RCC1 family protein